MKNLKINLFIITIIITILFSVKTAQSQDYYQAGGYAQSIGYFRYQATLTTGYLYDRIGVPFTSSAMYKATFAFNDHLAVSAYPSVGLSIEFNDYYDYYSFGMEMPVVGELFIGDLDDYSFIVGAGLSAAYMRTNDFGGFVFGPHLGIGGQFYYLNNLVGLRLSYTHGMNRTKIDQPVETVLEDSRKIFTLSVYYPF